MEIQVLIEPVAGNGYRARNIDPFGLSVEGATQEEALSRLRRLVQDQLSAGARVLQLRIPDQDNPWLRMAGTLDPNDPLVQEWKQIMEENRRKADADPDYL